jgi:hypothetical protein
MFNPKVDFDPRKSLIPRSSLAHFPRFSQETISNDGAIPQVRALAHAVLASA